MAKSAVVITGPTASGKTALAMDVAEALPAEIISMDSRQVYRGMDIGTAKPSVEDRAEVAHHLIDVLDPTEVLSVAGFQTLARKAIDEVRATSHTPLLGGGSGLYWRAVVDDLHFPPTDPAVRAALEERWWSDPDGAHRHLADLDPAAAARIEPANLRRTVRALEVLELTGERFSTFSAAWKGYDSVLGDIEVAYLEPPAEVLRDRVHDRARAMVSDGLLNEARDLRATYGTLSHTAVQAIGYAEAFAVLDGDLPESRLAEVIATRTWRYAKRQRSWFQADPRCIPTSPAAAIATLVG
jgi:tRNA dimethylallyltransferase